jgi:hypothetical protein
VDECAWKLQQMADGESRAGSAVEVCWTTAGLRCALSPTSTGRQIVKTLRRLAKEAKAHFTTLRR